MNYATFRDLTIKLINSYSASGNLIPITDSSVQDAVLRFAEFANVAQIEIATTAKYILKSVMFDQISSVGTTYKNYALPLNLFKIRKVEANEIIINWELTDRYNIRVLANLTGPIKVFYYAYPTPIPENPIDNFIFDLDEDACQAIPYYVASQVLIDDPVNKSVSDKLFAMYQGKLQNLSNVITKGSKNIKNTMYSKPNTLF